VALSAANIQRARKHLGYMQVRSASSYAFGIPQLTTLQYMFEDAITRILPEAEADAIELLDRLDCIDKALFKSHGDLFAKRVEGLEINLGQPDALELEYARWAQRLGDMLGVMPYPMAPRFKSLLGGGVGNIKVMR
jgi:hypothetical protein